MTELVTVQICREPNNHLARKHYPTVSVTYYTSYYTSANLAPLSYPAYTAAYTPASLVRNMNSCNEAR